MPPKPEPMLANPQIDPSVLVGNTSAGKESRTALQAVYPAMARETSAMERQALSTKTAGIAAVMQRANRLTVPLRATLTLIPACNSLPQTQPPARLPRSAARNGIQPTLPIEASSKCRALLRYSGNQKI